MKLIEFLMNNIFIVVIIFGALASVFGKSGKKKKPGRMPDFGGGGVQRPSNQQERGSHEEEQQVPSASSGQTVYRSQSQSRREENDQPAFAAREQELTAETSQIASVQRVLQRAANNKEKASASAERKYAGQSAISAPSRSEDLKRAVIWAEILGPPRSKRPFRK
ncbi:hypothetical protein [Paenibacillus sinopodophylli]|uniref:hypothetical protein n=1 Tax=Paenibacillus sinopodophylli TaxID=1837342 RepID=UPI00110CF79E|nr:hypothetical protein [Paenibacillus sinopodophylli]